MLSAAVAIVDHGTHELAEACMASIFTEDELPTWCDSLSYSNTAPPQENVGYAAALNAMFAEAEAPILIACNADVEFPRAVEPLLELFERFPRLGVLGPRQVNMHGYIVHAGIERLGDTSGGRAFGRIDTDQYREPLKVVPQVSGSVMLIRREAYDQVGGFTNMPRLYYEDTLLCHRMMRAGWAVGYSGLVTFKHHVAASPGANRAELAAEARRFWLAERDAA